MIKLRKSLLVTVSLVLLTGIVLCQDKNNKVEIPLNTAISVQDSHVITNIKQTEEKMKNQATSQKSNIINDTSEAIEISELDTSKADVSNDKNKFQWPILLTGLLGALLGALIGLSPYLIEHFKSVEIHGKIISLNYYPNQTTTLEIDKLGNTENIKGIGYRFNSHLVSNKYINLKSVKLLVQYDKEYIDGRLFYIPDSQQGKNYSEFIQYTPFMEANKSYTKYLTFIVSKDNLPQLNEIDDLLVKFDDPEFIPNQNEIKELKKHLAPNKLKVVFENYDDEKTELVIDLNIDVDYGSIVPEK